MHHAKKKDITKTNEYDSSKQKLNRVETGVPDDLTLFDIPPDIETPSDYEGNFSVTKDTFPITYEDTDYNAVIYLELDDNHDINTIAFSTDVTNAFGLEQDFILTEEDFNEQLKQAVGEGGTGPIVDCLKKLFLGTPEYGPCQGTWRWGWLHHWLIGDHSFKELCCTCNYWDSF